MEDKIKALENYNPKSEKYKTQRTSTLLNAKEFYKGRKMILIAFENDMFPLPKQYPSDMDDWEKDHIDSSQVLPKKSHTLLPSSQRKEKAGKEKPKNIVNELNRLIVEKDKIINKEIFKKCFGFQVLIDMQRELYEKKHRQKKLSKCD